MKLMLENAILEIRPGVRVIASASGVLVVELEPVVEPARKGLGNGAAEPVKPKPPVSDDVPEPQMDSLPLGFLENEILSSLMKQPDPHAWRRFSEILDLAFPTMARRDGNAMSRDYAYVCRAVRRLRDNGELDYERAPAGRRGRQAKAFYRIHKDETTPAAH